MCGIVGVICKKNNGFNYKALKAFQDLLFMDTLRGEDSTGIMAIDYDGNVNVLKDAVAAPWFLMHEEVQKVVDREAFSKGKVLVGHNRKATMGTLDENSAHPWIVDDEFVLVHNGTLNSHKELAKVEIDSQALAIHLHNKLNDTEDKAKVFDEIKGAYALVFYDVRTNCINFVRNFSRPLFIADTEDNIWFASEDKMLISALSRNDQQIKAIKELKTHKLIYYDLSADSLLEQEVDVVPSFTQPHRMGPTTHTNTGHTSQKGMVDGLSKNKFKQLCNKLIGNFINFYIEDFTEVGESTSDYYFYGYSLDLDFPHELIGECDSSIGIEVIDNANKAIGKITEVRYNKETKRSIINVELIDRQPPPILSNVIQLPFTH